jgi:hypothetical protein
LGWNTCLIPKKSLKSAKFKKLTHRVDENENDPDYYFKLGHLLGKAAVLGSMAQEIVPTWKLSAQLELKILASASQIRRVTLRPQDCRVDFADEFFQKSLSDFEAGIKATTHQSYSTSLI